MFQICGRQPDLHALPDMLHCVREHDFCVVIVVQSCGLEPDVLAPWARFTPHLDHFPGGDHTPGVLFQASGGNPPRCVLRV